VRDDPGLAGSVRGMPWCPTQVSGRGHRTGSRLASLESEEPVIRIGEGPAAADRHETRGIRASRPGTLPSEACNLAVDVSLSD